MNHSPDTKDAYLACSINGSQYILQAAPSSPEAFINIENLDEETLTLSSDPGESQSDELESENQSSPTISLICVDGQFYTLPNDQLQKIGFAPENLELEIRQESEDLILVSEISENSAQTTKENTNFDGNPTENSKEQGHLTENLKTNLTENLISRNLTENVKANVVRGLKDNLIAVKNPPEDQATISLEVVGSNSPQEIEEFSPSDYLEVVTAFKCKICPYTSQDRSQLLEHFKKSHTTSGNATESNDVKLLYMCGECSNCFPSMDSCREHMINDHQLTEMMSSSKNQEKLVDPKGKSKNSKASSAKNVQAMKNQKNTKRKTADPRESHIKCRHRGCLQKFSTEELMQKHASCHIDSASSSFFFKCPHCADVKFVKWKVCSMHLWKEHGVDIDLLSCEICRNYKASTQTKLSVHMRIHSDDRNYECKDCGKKFKQSSQLRNHRVIHGHRKSGDVQKWYSSRTCDICGKTYADSKCLKNHMQAVHSKLRPYVCNVCGHASARKAMLQMHLRQHTGDKPFSCDICDFKTGDHNSLRRHMMRHTGVRPYKCPHCSYSAIQSSCYKNHLKVKHPESAGLFTCNLCSFKTVKKETYIEHVGNHEKGLIKTSNQKKEKENSIEVFPGNIAAAQLIYSCLGAFSKVGKTIEASLMSSSTSADGTSQTITIQIPSKHLEGSLPMADGGTLKSSVIEQEDDETMHCFLKIPREEEENIDTGGITIPAEPEENDTQILNVES